MKIKLFYAVACVCIASMSGYGSVELPEQVCHHDELIGRTQNIVLATVISAVYLSDGGKVLYQFRTEKVIKGNAYGRDYFSIKGRPSLYEHDLRSFDFHSDGAFWTNNRSRIYVSEDIKVNPSFCTGCTYLIFLGHPYHVRGFERIIDTKNDKWLVYVEKKVEEQAIKQAESNEASRVDSK